MTRKDLINALSVKEFRLTDRSRIYCYRSDGEFAELTVGDIAVVDACDKERRTAGEYDIYLMPTGEEGARSVKRS